MKKNYALVIVFAVLIISLMTLSLTNVIDEEIGMCVSLALSVIFTIIVAITAYKKGVMLVLGLMIALMLSGIVLLGININSILNSKTDDNMKFYVSLENNDSEKKQIFSFNGKDYYSYNTDKIKVNLLEENRVYSLEDALKEGHITLDEILKLAIQSEDTEGYKIYYDGGTDEYDKDQYSVVICQNEKDVIFAPYEYTYNSSICEN